MALGMPRWFHPSRGIRQLLLVMLLVLLVPVLGVQAASYFAQFRNRRSRELAEDLQTAVGAAKSLQLALQEIRRDEMAIGHIFVTPPSPPPSLWNAILQRYERDYGTVGSFTWLDAHGRVIASSEPAAVGQDLGEEHWFRRIVSGDDWVVTDLERRQDGSFHSAQAIRDGRGGLAGVIVASIVPAQLASELDLPQSEGQVISILDHTGWLVLQSPPRPTDSEQRDWLRGYPVVAEALRGETRTGSGLDSRLRERHLFALTPVPDTGWVIAVAEPEAQVTGPILTGLARDGALVLGVAAIAFLVALAVARSISRPIERLSDYALAVGRGEYPSHAAARGPRELQSLSQAFEHMAYEVQHREHEHQQLLQSERARARNARLLAAIQRAMSNTLVYVDADLRILRVNPAAEAMLGRRRADLLGRTAAEVLARAPNILALIEQARRTREEVRLTEYPHSLAAHEELGRRFFDMSISPVTANDGTFEGLVIVSADVTDRVRQREERVAAERARAELAETLNAEISHRLKNHLMMAFTLLHMQITQAEDDRVKTILRDTAARLLTFASIHEQLQASPEGRVDLLAAVRRIAEAAREAAPEAELAVEGTATQLRSRDVTNLALVANELLTNAVKQGGPDADGKLHLEASLTREAGELRLSVWNSGNPVPEDFDPAQQRGMGLQLVTTLVGGAYQGSFTLRPYRGGSLAEVRIAESKLAA